MVDMEAPWRRRPTVGDVIVILAIFVMLYVIMTGSIEVVIFQSTVPPYAIVFKKGSFGDGPLLLRRAGYPDQELDHYRHVDNNEDATFETSGPPHMLRVTINERKRHKKLRVIEIRDIDQSKVTIESISTMSP